MEEAEKRFLEVIEEEELSADGYYELAKIYLIKGDKDTAIKYINTAIDSNAKRIVEKVKKEPIFIPIMAKISMPFNLEEPEQKGTPKLQEKEIKAKEHLEEMSEITRNLSNHDIKMLKKNSSGRSKKIEQKNQEQEQEEQKERRD